MPKNASINESSTSMGLTLLTTKNPVFCCYLFWCSVLVIKMLLMSLLTATQRLLKNAFANVEDTALAKNSTINLNDPDVERVRRAHLNDLENILPLLLMSLLYVTTDPNPMVARMLFRIAGSSRILHTLVYAFRPVPQPSRAIAFFVAFFITIFMAVWVAVHNMRFI